MKMSITLVLGMILGGSLAMAGVGQFDSTGFNDIINDNLKAEKELNLQLQAGAGVEVKELHIAPGPRSADKLIEVADADAVVAPTTEHKIAKPQDQTQAPLMDRNMKRVSSELSEIGQ